MDRQADTEARDDMDAKLGMIPLTEVIETRKSALADYGDIG
jgi:hypothetical protein